MTPSKIKELVAKAQEDMVRVFGERARVNVKQVVFFEKGATAGYARKDGVLRFNTVLAKENPETFENTVYHEVAHLVTWKMFPNAKQHHGPEFKYVMRAVGKDGSTYHSYNTASVSRPRKRIRHEAVCANGVKYLLTTQMVNKMKQGYTISCRCCRDVVVLTGVVKNVA